MSKYSLKEKAILLANHYLGRLLPPPRRARRGFDAARATRLLNDWVRSSKSIDEDIKSDLTVLRARSRDLCVNNDYGRRFMWLLKSNVIGPNGIRLQPKVRTADGGRPDTDANEKIKAAWDRWCRPENCTVTGKLSFKDVLDLFIQGLPRDGEILFRRTPAFNNNFQFALQLFDPEYLDHNYSDTRQRIKMGVQLNQWKAPIAYYVLKDHPGEGTFMTVGDKYERIPAADIIHEFVFDRVEQTRGFPWTVTALKRMHMLGHYEESELVAARVGAAKMGFFTREDAGYAYDDKDASGNLIDEVAPGQFKELPAGYGFQKFDIDHPNTAFDEFVKSILRGAASGLNVSYISLANDLKETSYASGRQGLLEERGFYMMLQGWLIEHVCQPVFDAWLPWAITSGQLRLPMRDVERWRAVMWQGRRWSWIDPKNDAQASETAVALGINSRTRIAAEHGADIDDIFEDLARERKRAALLKINIDNDEPKEQDNAENDQDRHLTPYMRIRSK